MHRGTLFPAPILSVDSRRLFTVKDFYLCQLDRLMVVSAYKSLDQLRVAINAK